MNQRPSPIQKVQQYPTRYTSNNFEKTPPYKVDNAPQRSEQPYRVDNASQRNEQPHFQRVQSQIFQPQDKFTNQPQDKFTKQPSLPLPPPYHNYTNNKSISPQKKRENSTETRPIITIGGTKNMSLDHRKTMVNNMEQNKFSKKPSYEIINIANVNTQPI